MPWAIVRMACSMRRAASLLRLLDTFDQSLNGNVSLTQCYLSRYVSEGDDASDASDASDDDEVSAPRKLPLCLDLRALNHADVHHL